MTTARRGRFITFEGIDGAGKTSHLNWFADRLRALGHSVDVTREPGGTALAEALRARLLGDSMAPLTETLLAFAARHEHVQQRIEPALARGTWVVCDRFSDSTYAYQGGGRGIDPGWIETLERWCHPGLQPDLTLLFDLSPEEAAARRAAARPADRFEAEDLQFFGRVRSAYLARAADPARRFATIDTTSSKEEVRVLLEKIISTL